MFWNSKTPTYSEGAIIAAANKRAEYQRIDARDKLAVEAMKSLLANPAALPITSEDGVKRFASACYDLADAMLEARK